MVLPDLISGLKSAWDTDRHLGVFDLAESHIFSGQILLLEDNLFHGRRNLPSASSFKRAKVILKLPVLIGFNESVTFQGGPTISGVADLNRIHIKEALGCNSERGSPQEDEELIILWFCDSHRQRGWSRESRGEGERKREREMWGRVEKTSVKERF